MGAQDQLIRSTRARERRHVPESFAISVGDFQSTIVLDAVRGEVRALVVVRS